MPSGQRLGKRGVGHSHIALHSAAGDCSFVGTPHPQTKLQSYIQVRASLVQIAPHAGQSLRISMSVISPKLSFSASAPHSSEGLQIKVGLCVNIQRSSPSFLPSQHTSQSLQCSYSTMCLYASERKRATASAASPCIHRETRVLIAPTCKERKRVTVNAASPCAWAI